MGRRKQDAGFEDGGRGHTPRKARNATLEAGKGEDTDSFLDLQTQDLQKCKSNLQICHTCYRTHRGSWYNEKMVTGMGGSVIGQLMAPVHVSDLTAYYTQGPEAMFQFLEHPNLLPAPGPLTLL